MKKTGQYLKSYDSFGETFKMKLDQGQSSLKSVMGTVLSFIYFTIVIGYTVQKFDILISRKDVDIALAVRDNYFGDDDAFKGSAGFNVAIALTSFSEERQVELLPEYAELRVEYSIWDVKEDGKIFSDKIKLESHPCSHEELGLTGDHSKFMPIHETATAYVILFKNKFMCLEQKDLEIYGNFNAKKAKILRAYLDRCHDKEYCKTEKEIDKYMEDKYLLILRNQIRFD